MYFILRLGFVCALITWSSLVAAATIDDRIEALESELAELKQERIELRKEATAAAAAMPTFSYRPGNGLTIEASDKAWSFRTSMEAHLRWIFESGRDDKGRTNGEVMGRRVRTYTGDGRIHRTRS